ncbi:FGGY-family carbohydrate kinase [Rhizobium bangladeshense]|uniref:Carbohydrate kinase n=1 Tax=Rhizobium bangladeshense TaxID=1138189 RepID=A0ABS7LJT1_9HYPH|nr:FGGY-family carbohydrate kinase [Rhizobium bangladeshense]MBX4867147.1 carbohydrate kinase [Rhizobium bangladeshense]MBX4871438.1 carbohydrate kinase [Rhizobium bangladeshense]MBX4882752.1 carbohydrate kinase [Rhizobium bangladeshense]MBX4897080.1 carbohydrate kinase [Rhizobium bangladeshense]MBX4900881.1 carbohydrate kinase [Rhizobium bangladeshense]
MPSLLGIDSGLTVTKAVVFDVDGTAISVARRRVSQRIPKPRFVERDMHELWSATAEAIREAIALSGRPASDIQAVAATAHGDGIYLVDGGLRPLGNGIVSLDSRAGDIVDLWTTNGVAEKAITLTGQAPHVSAPSALLAFIHDHEPERFSHIGHIMSCKDWLRFCLTGSAGTDRTEASTSFVDVETQGYSEEALHLFGLDALSDALLPAARSDEIVGRVTAEAARLTGLVEGTPVAAGLHDVVASALGAGGYAEGVVAIVAGTYSINETLTSKARVDRRWFCRNAIAPGIWNAMSISPASSANYEWFIEKLCAADWTRCEAEGVTIHALLASEIDAALARPSPLLFHPYLYGSPYGASASGSFFGLGGWHDRGDMLRAVLEGIAFNHRIHVDALREGFAFTEARLSGGISRNPAVVQMFADVLAMPVTVTGTDEAAAWGAALCAGVGAGIYHDLQSASNRREPGGTCRPDPGRSSDYEKRYRLFVEIAETMKPLWPKIAGLADQSAAHPAQ